MDDDMPRLVVGPVARSGGRTVRVGHQILGVAYDDRDLVEFTRRAGHPDPESIPFAGPDRIEWRGQGAGIWEQ